MIGVPPDPPGTRRSGLDLTLPGEQRVAIAGDWHGNTLWVQQALPGLHRAAPDIRTVLQLGDFGYWPRADRPGKGFLAAVDYWCKLAQLERILFTPGNHEYWPDLLKLFAEHPDRMVQVTEYAWAMPRGYRFTLGGRDVMSFGGAASHDVQHRVEGQTWFREEVPTPEEAERAMVDPKVDILLSHDAPSPTPLVTKIIRRGRAEHDIDTVLRDDTARGRLFDVWDFHRPRIAFHGHFHTPDSERLSDGRRVYSLGMDRQLANLGVLDLTTLDFDWLVDAPPPADCRR